MEKKNSSAYPNQFRALIALTKASIIQSLRNPSMLFFSFFFPVMIICIFGILDFNSLHVSIDVHSGTDNSSPVYTALKKISGVTLNEGKSDSIINDDLTKGTVAVAVKITSNNDAVNGLTTYAVNLEKSAAAPSDASIIETVISSITSQINEQANPNSIILVSLNESVVEGHKYKQIDFILPGQLAFALLTNALFGISFSFVVMKKDKILKRIFAAPVKKSTVIFAEGLSKLIIAIIQTMIIIAVGYYVFGFYLAHGFQTILEMMILSFIGIFVFISLGFLIAVISKDNEDSVSPIANLIMMPQMFLSGAYFDITAFPSWLQPIARLLPMTLLDDAYKVVAFQGGSILSTWPQLLGLFVWAILIYAVVLKMFTWD